MFTNPPRLPRHRIPKIKAWCIACNSDKLSTVMSQAFSAGYHRRHICNTCDAAFYTLAHYEGGKYETQDRPFKDRALSPWEERQRLEWEAEGQNVTLEVASVFATEFIEAINVAFQKQASGGDLTMKQQELVSVIEEIERKFYGYE